MSVSSAVGVGFIGTGMISDTYLENLTSFADVRVVILGDLDRERARQHAEKYNVPEWDSTEDVLAHPDVEIVVNLTIPAAHAEIASQAIVCRHPRDVIEGRPPAPKVFVRRRVPGRRSSDGSADRR